MRKADVVVVGAGVMGSATAWRLAARGHDVVLLEQFDLCHDRGSSHGAVRVFRFSYDDPAYFEMVDGAQVVERYAAVFLPGDTSVLFQKDAGVVAAEVAVKTLAEQAVDRGAELHERSPTL